MDAATPEPTFAPAVECHHRRFDPAEWRDLHVVGDVHGCRRELTALLDRLGVTREDLVVFVGDLVRKGPESEGVLDLVRDAPNLHSVRGNNEQKLLDGTVEGELDDGALEAVAGWPLVISFADSIVVHGGVLPSKPLSEHAPVELLETRSLAPGGGYTRPFWFEAYAGPPRVFFGHTVLAAPHAGEWAVGLDTGCVYGGALTAYDWRADRLRAVPAAEAYQPRSADSIVTPRQPGTVARPER